MADLPEWDLNTATEVLLENLEKETFEENKFEVYMSLYTLLKEEKLGNKKAKAITDYIREITKKNKEEK